MAISLSGLYVATFSLEACELYAFSGRLFVSRLHDGFIVVIIFNDN